MKKIMFLCLLLSGMTAIAQTDTDKTAIDLVLENQLKAWNKGDIDTFMQSYWHSDSLRFIGSHGIAYGWKATLDNYKKNYPDKAAMGTLRFELVSTELLGTDAAFVTGKWFLLRPQKGNLNGYFTLLWRKIKGRWVIVTDHSS